MLLHHLSVSNLLNYSRVTSPGLGDTVDTRASQPRDRVCKMELVRALWIITFILSSSLMICNNDKMLKHPREISRNPSIMWLIELQMLIVKNSH